MIIEVCVDSLESAVIAKKAGADQVELISLASVGGITPSYGLIEAVQERGIDSMVMVRPRAAGFYYSTYDKEVMLKDVEYLRKMGVKGVVFGALNEDRSIDYEFTKKMVEASGEMQTVFHRAFEVVENKVEAAEKLRNIGVRRILTKGGSNTLFEGKNTLLELLKIEGIEIISGGVRENTLELIKEIGLKMIHVSSNKKRIDKSTAGTGIYYGASNSEADEIYTVSDYGYLKKIIAAFR